ncbi:RNA polymerase, sigma-24 subunit, RpoE [Sphingobium faniae]|nr:RNA polymerase, sigma-24 subunit, RpoE [Sphingobium faniae]
MTFDLSGCSDGELAGLALAGRQAAYNELVRRHRNWAFRVVSSHVGDIDEAVDIVQASFVAAFAALNRYDSRRPFAPWLSRILINKCRDWHRRRTVRGFLTFVMPVSDAAEIADSAPLPDQTIGNRRELARTMKAIAMLPTSLKETLILRTLEEKSEAETAEILGISQKAVEMRLYRARTRLTEILRKE